MHSSAGNASDVWLALALARLAVHAKQEPVSHAQPTCLAQGRRLNLGACSLLLACYEARSLTDASTNAVGNCAGWKLCKEEQAC